MSRNHIYAHYVFVTKYRQPAIIPEKERELFAYIMGITTNLGCTLIRINAALNHIHILVKLNTTITASYYVATVKRASSLYLKKTRLFPRFQGWAREYSVDSVSPHFVPVIKAYITKQKEHHQVKSFEQEWVETLPDDERASWQMRWFDS